MCLPYAWVAYAMHGQEFPSSQSLLWAVSTPVFPMLFLLPFNLSQLLAGKMLCAMQHQYSVLVNTGTCLGFCRLF